MVTITKETGTIEVSNTRGKEFRAGDIVVPMSKGVGFIANLPPEFFEKNFTVEVICEKIEYVPNTELPEQPIIEE
ncbi:MAG: hypothetical protein LCH52_05425 [Bacteroidetes bacterium]|nr:hypothetical protein [Bacteroidota bacterium]